MAASASRADINHREYRYPKVFIQRDYSEGTNVKFQTKFPPELDGLIDRHSFEQTINTLNRIYAEAEKTSSTTFCEGCFACLTSYLIYLCIETHYQKCLKRISAYLEEQNETIWVPRGLLITDPIERGLRIMLLTEGISPHLTSDVIDRCKQAGIKTVLDFLSCDTETLATKISTAYKDVSSIQRVLLACYASFPQSADSLYDEQLQSLSILNTGISRLDEFLDGGVYTSEITEIYGLPGTGKTQFSLCILSSLILESENSALYLDSNGSFIGKRIEQMLLHKSNNFQMVGDAMNRLRVTNVYDIYNLFDALHYVKSQLCKQDQPFFSSLKLIVVDSLTPLIGPCLVGNQFDGLGLLMNASQLLKSLCYEHSLSVVICNNTVYGEDSVVTPALGRYWKHVPSVTLCINKRNDSLLSNTDRLRKLSVVKSCRSGTFGEVLLNITNDGISVIDV